MATPKEYRDRFVERVRIARVQAGFSVDEIAAILRIPPASYRKYEGGRGIMAPSIMPDQLKPLFCIATKISLDWLLTGEGKGPEVASPTRRSRRA